LLAPVSDLTGANPTFSVLYFSPSFKHDRKRL
jgi:hypothetical protein